MPATPSTAPSNQRHSRARYTAALRSHKASAARFALAIAAGAVLSTGAAAVASATPTMTMLPDISSHYSFTTLGDAADPTFNQLLGVNDFGVIAGYFGSGSPAAIHPNKGFTLTPYTRNAFTNENFVGSQQTQVTAINDWGNTVGFYASASGANYGYLDEGGVTSSVSDPLTTSKPPVNQLLSLNNDGQAAGFYNDSKGNSHAYIWDRITRAFTPVNPLGATSATATAINDHGAVGGFFSEANGNVASFIKQGTTWKILLVPGSATTRDLRPQRRGRSGRHVRGPAQANLRFHLQPGHSQDDQRSQRSGEHGGQRSQQPGPDRRLLYGHQGQHGRFYRLRPPGWYPVRQVVTAKPKAKPRRTGDTHSMRVPSSRLLVPYGYSGQGEP